MDPDSEEKYERAFHDVPFFVILLAVLVVGIEAVFRLAEAGIIGGPRGVGWRVAVIEAYGFSPAILDRVIVFNDYSFNTLRRFVTYPFLNLQLISVAFSAALILALGKFTCAFYSTIKVFVVFFAAAIFGAVMFGLLVEGRELLISTMTPVYGLIGAYTYALWLQLGEAGEKQYMAFRLIGFLLMLQLVFGLSFGGNSQWISELTGFVTGFLFGTVLAPGGWAALLVRLRRRS